MGLELTVWQITPKYLVKLLSSEEAIGGFMEFQFPDPDSPEDLNQDENPAEDDGLDLEKIWHLLHYLITGNESGGDYPLGYAIMTGHPFHEDSSDLTWLAPEEVKDIADALDNLSEEDLLNRCNLGKASKRNLYKYSGYFSKEDVKEAIPYFHKLRNYYRDAARKGNAMLVFVG